LTDTGIGIAKENLTRMFERFYQVEDHLTRTKGGLGLGLAIAKRIIEAHGGKIWAESAGPGLGSSFMFTLPIFV
jgi:signal transduction histidine kinase